MSFQSLGLIEPLLQAVRSEGYTTPTAIQSKAIPPVLAGGDLLGCAQTGTGKTAAFALPILQRLHGHRPASPRKGRPPIRALVLAPTRELAAQIGDSFRAYGRHTGLRTTVIFGGVKQSPQERALAGGVDILVATPGRLLDLLGQKLLSLAAVEVLVLDEADRMLDMGFIHDIRRVVALVPKKRQTLLFSATMPREIQSLADSLLESPVKVSVAPESPAAHTVRQRVYFVETHQKPLMLEHLLRDPGMTRALVFTRTKRGADRVVHRLTRSQIAAEAIHSNKSQNQRTRALDNFKKGKTRVLAASDIAARGLDVDDITHVINYDLPGDAETYVHRIGRTGRAGAQGEAISLCCGDQKAELRDIERLLGKSIPVEHAGIELPSAPETPERPSPRKPAGASGRHRAAHGGSSAGSGGSRGGRSRRKRGGSEQAAASPSRGAHTLGESSASREAAGSPERRRNDFWRRKRRDRSATSGAGGRSGGGSKHQGHRPRGH
ncbi:MAG TPA: DEAD/DEAH box helicase [Phycisphaerae bacterium]|nr:DEAD/DEAH box helicase [Phycisphaerae bacterium]